MVDAIDSPGGAGSAAHDGVAAAQRVAAGLPPALQPPFRRLARELLALSAERHWRLEIAQYVHTDSRERVATAIEALLPRALRVVAGAQHADWPALEQAIADAAAKAPLVQVMGLAQWLDPLAAATTASRLRAINLRREALASLAPVPLLFWLREAQVSDWVAHAPDMWSWRSGVHRFADDAAAQAGALAPLLRPFVTEFYVDARGLDERRERVAELRSFLDATVQQPVSQLRVDLVDELADLHASLGELDEALQLRTAILAVLCEGLGDPRETAINRGRIADILQARGQLDEALRIRQQEQLPVYERLGDVRAKAVTLGKIADILQVRGQLDEALRIQQDEVLPVVERLGDVHAKAVTLGNIADILQDRGNLDEALRIRLQEELPVYERLGDMRAKAIAMGRIADILQARSQLDEALRIRQQEELPVYERLGDVRSKAITSWKIGRQRWAAGGEERQEAQALFHAALAAMRAMGLLEAVWMAEEMRHLGLNPDPSRAAAGANAAPAGPRSSPRRRSPGSGRS